MKCSKPVFIDNGSKIGILILHGFSSTPEQLRDAVDFACKNGFNVSVPLIAGHGTCPEDLRKTSPEDWKRSARDAYLELKKISEKVFIVGSSFGSNLAFWLAKEFNNEQAGIISLSAPIFLKYHTIILLRLYSYGLFQKYYQKPAKSFGTNQKLPEDEIVYYKLPTKSVREFLRFIKKETIPNLRNVKIPTLIFHSIKDNIVHPKSARYIYKHLGSGFKQIQWADIDSHFIAREQLVRGLFQQVYDFIQDVVKDTNISLNKNV
jgi:carboxylesterase